MIIDRFIEIAKEFGDAVLSLEDLESIKDDFEKTFTPGWYDFVPVEESPMLSEREYQLKKFFDDISAKYDINDIREIELMFQNEEEKIFIVKKIYYLIRDAGIKQALKESVNIYNELI